MVYGYARVSSKGQTNNNSFEQQESEIKIRYENSIIFQEQFTGMKTKRPILSELISKLQAGDLLVVTKLDRLARTTIEGVELIQSLFSKGVSIHVLNIGLLEDTTMGKFFITVLLAVAELERNQIIERTQEGKAIAKLDPEFKEGRPKVYKRAQINHALELLETYSYKKVEEITGISKSTLIRAKRNSNMHQ